MARRMIDDSIWANERFAEMPMGARLLQLGIINHADDQGRMKANPTYLRAQVFPYDDVAPQQVQQWLILMVENDTIILYEAEGRQYLQLVNWWKYQSLQYAQPSQHPRPAGWKDRIRRTLTKGLIVTCNWQKVNGEPIDDTCDMDGKALLGRKPKRDKENDDSPTTKSGNTPEDAEESYGYSGEYSGECLAEGTIELNLTKLNEKENIPRANGTAPKTNGVPPTSSNEYLPGLPDPRKRPTAQTLVAERTMQAKALGVDAMAFRLVVDALLDGFGKKALADAGDEKTLNHAQDVALIVMGISERFRTPTGVATVFKSWHDNDWRGDSLPTSEQYKEHASLMAAGKVVCTRKDKPPEPATFSFKQWMLRTHNADNPKFIGIPLDVLKEEYNTYVRQH
jgi:hypothetical protein